MTPEAPNLSQSQRQRAQLEEQLKDAVRGANQQARLIWLLVSQQPGLTITVDESTVHPLWELGFDRIGGEKSTMLQVTAKQMPEPTDQQLDMLAERLVNTSNHPGDAMTAVGLSDYPFSFLSKLLSNRIKFADGLWKKVEPEPPAL
jgi:hypothetical protein